MKRCELCLLLALLACSEKPKPAPSPPAAPDVVAARPKPVVREYQGPRATQLSGEVMADPRLAQGERLKAGQPVRLAKGATLQLSLEGGARVQFKGPSLLAATSRSDQGVMVHHGTVTVELPPGGAEGGLGRAFVATPFGVVRLGRSAIFWLRVADRHADLAVVGGRVHLDTYDRSHSSQHEFVAGRVVKLNGSSKPVDRAGPSTLDAAERAFAYEESAPEPAPKAVEQALMGRLTLAYAGTEVAIQRQKDLDAQHQRAHATRSPGIMDIQRQIASHAAEVYRARRDLENVLLQIESALLNAPAGERPDSLVSEAQALLR